MIQLPYQLSCSNGHTWVDFMYVLTCTMAWNYIQLFSCVHVMTIVVHMCDISHWIATRLTTLGIIVMTFYLPSDWWIAEYLAGSTSPSALMSTTPYEAVALCHTCLTVQIR